MRGLRSLLLCAGLLASSGAVAACGRASPARSAVLPPPASVAASAANPVAVSPLPGTDDASPATQISFLGAAGTRVSHVRVSGSRTGVHAGTLRAYSTGTGDSFLPATPFATGERVSVRANVRVGSRVRVANTTFTIADRATVSQAEFPLTGGDPRAVQHYRSAPQLTPSTVTVTTPAQPGAAEGYLMLAPYQGAGSPGPMIADQSGGLVWFDPLGRGLQATNLAVQRYLGKPVLTWWQGRILQLGFGVGEDLIYDTSYRRIARVRAGNGYSADLHEIRITGQGTAWIDAFDPIRMNLPRAHGSAQGLLSDSIVQEIDIRTGLVMWEWHALGHIPFAESNNPAPPASYPWDYAHVNSIDPGPAGDVLLSARNTWALYDVDIHSGGVRWRLGGSGSSFRQGPGASFYWQHDAEFQPGGLISLFDNGSDPPKEKQSRGLLLAPDPATHTVTLARQFANPSRTLLAESQGNAYSLPHGSWLLGYGRLPNFTEFDASGRVLLDGSLGRGVQSFKTTLAPWHARPATPPSLVVSRGSAGALTAKVSWNGATDVTSWRLLAGASPGALAPVATAARQGFETTVSASARGAYVAVQALDGAGDVIGVSPALRT
ncbi:MAG TPA: arylsulfotransferase family protein [Solirubrobacteraceae bacterium]|jgi:hypothetical protein